MTKPALTRDLSNPSIPDTKACYSSRRRDITKAHLGTLGLIITRHTVLPYRFDRKTEWSEVWSIPVIDRATMSMNFVTFNQDYSYLAVGKALPAPVSYLLYS